jgi:hypothetical protein
MSAGISPAPRRLITPETTPLSIPTTPATAPRLRSQLTHRRPLSVLSGLMRHCSARKIGPGAVDETVLDAYMFYRTQTTALASNAAARRAIAKCWNACIAAIDGWPARRLIEPAPKTAEGPA